MYVVDFDLGEWLVFLGVALQFAGFVVVSRLDLATHLVKSVRPSTGENYSAGIFETSLGDGEYLKKPDDLERQRIEAKVHRRAMQLVWVVMIVLCGTALQLLGLAI